MKKTECEIYSNSRLMLLLYLLLLLKQDHYSTSIGINERGIV